MRALLKPALLNIKAPEAVLCAVLALWMPHSLALSTSDKTPPERIVALGDVHGDFSSLTTMLKKTDLVDDSLHWIGGSSVLVQLGDFTDRGARVRETIDLLMRLQDEAPRQGGEVIVLMGNHEMMNVVGDYRYVSSEVYAFFVDDRSGKRRSDAFKDYLKWREYRSGLYGDVDERDAAEVEAAWMESHPPGYFEYQEAMGPTGVYGKWLRKLPVVVKLGDTIFLHGGIHPSLARMDLDELNKTVAKERALHDTLRKYLVARRVVDSSLDLGESFKMAKQQLKLMSGKSAWARVGVQSGIREELLRTLTAYLKMGDWLSMGQDGPLWFRGYATWTEEEGKEPIEKVLEEYQARRFVVAHTIVNGNLISSRFEGQLILIDTIEPCALIIEDTRLVSVYSNEELSPRPVIDSMSPGPVLRAQ
jgi:hypothetical protein